MELILTLRTLAVSSPLVVCPLSPHLLSIPLHPLLTLSSPSRHLLFACSLIPFPLSTYINCSTALSTLEMVRWVADATNAARAVLGDKRLITHAPQPPYFGIFFLFLPLLIILFWFLSIILFICSTNIAAGNNGWADGYGKIYNVCLFTVAMIFISFALYCSFIFLFSSFPNVCNSSHQRLIISLFNSTTMVQQTHMKRYNAPSPTFSIYLFSPRLPPPLISLHHSRSPRPPSLLLTVF